MADPLKGLEKVGQAKLKVLFWDVYYSTLYTSNSSYQIDQYPQVLKIDYLRDIEAQDLIDKTEEEWQKLGLEPSQYSKWIPLLNSVFPDIKKGDTLMLIVNEAQHSEFLFNGESVGNITDTEFGPSFLRIWLDEKSSYPKVRNKLVGAQ